MSALDEAQELIDTLTPELADIDVLVTLDPTGTGGQLSAGGSVLIVGPPTREYRASALPEFSWELFIVTGPYDDLTQAWAKLDVVLERLENIPHVLEIERVEPASFKSPGSSGYEYSAYIVRFSS